MLLNVRKSFYTRHPSTFSSNSTPTRLLCQAIIVRCQKPSAHCGHASLLPDAMAKTSGLPIGVSAHNMQHEHKRDAARNRQGCEDTPYMLEGSKQTIDPTRRCRVPAEEGQGHLASLVMMHSVRKEFQKKCLTSFFGNCLLTYCIRLRTQRADPCMMLIAP